MTGVLIGLAACLLLFVLSPGIKSWIARNLYNFLAPQFMPALDDCNAKNLKPMYESQRENHQRLNKWMEEQATQILASNKNHQELIQALDRICEVIKGNK